ncbi:MAG: hypothetical protein QOK11_3417 [Pseudonocardiales bacterium]|nr:hypothetical protein [Pseudonocardiales bacterium]
MNEVLLRRLHHIGPLLHTRAGLGASAITLVLLGFGLFGAAISSPSAASADLAREALRAVPAPSQGATDRAGSSAQRTR